MTQAPDLDERLRRSKIGEYLLADEVPILAQHQHWAAIAEPVGSAVGALTVVIALNYWLSASLLTDLLWWAWFVVAVRAFVKWILWRREWLVSTDRRLLVNYGLIHQGVAMLSLARVVDLTYTRSTLGQLLGYGTLERESTGENQTLHEVKWVKHPDATYLTISAAIFDLPNRPRKLDDDPYRRRVHEDQPPQIPELYAGYTSVSRRQDPADPRDGPVEAAPAQAQSDLDEEPVGIQIQYGRSPKGSREPGYPSPELAGFSIRDADTGPIPYRRSTTDAGTWRPTTDEQDLNLDPDHGGDSDDEG
jgi:hypothetical protein